MVPLAQRPWDTTVARGMKTVAYLRISTGSQDLANQKLAILDYARQNRFAIERFVEAQASSRKGRDQRRVEELERRLKEQQGNSPAPPCGRN